MRNIFILVAALAVVGCSRDVGIVMDDLSDVQRADTVVCLRFGLPWELAPMTRAGAVEIGDAASRLDVFLVCGTDTMVAHQRADSTSGFGRMQAVVNKTKTYLLVAVAHNGDAPVRMSGGELLFPGDLTDTFVYSGDLVPAGMESEVVAMRRCVGMLKLWITDQVPDDVSAWRVTMSEASRSLRVDGSRSEETATRVQIINGVRRASDGTVRLNFFAFGDDDDAVNLGLRCEALTAAGETVEARSWEAVPVRNNYVTTYKGPFFVTGSVDMNFVAFADWQKFDVVDM